MCRYISRAYYCNAHGAILGRLFCIFKNQFIMRFSLGILLIASFLAGKVVVTGHYQNRVIADTVRLNHHKKNRTVKEEFDPDKRYPAYDCVFTKKLSLKQRLKKYPFLDATNIMVVSYKSGPEKDGESINSRLKRNLHITEGILNRASIIEAKTLSAQQISELTNIIYNTDYRNHHQKPFVTEFKCYEPRNAIIFYKEDGKIYDYLEICFECQKTSSLSDQITIGTDCNQKLDLMRNFLISVGIKYGTTKID
jgi:hypothetical protein